MPIDGRPRHSRRTNRSRARALVAVLAAALTLATSCTLSSDDQEGADSDPDATFGDAGDCIAVDMAISPEKIDLMNALATQFNDSGAEVEGRCVFVRPARKSSGAAARALIDGWPVDANGPQPAVWSPAASTWGQVVNQRLADRGEAPIAPAADPFMLTPLVIAMPEPMATALGWPDTPIGWADILELARSQQGWADHGHPEWGAFKLGKTNPNFSTSGLAALIAQTYAATGKSEGLSAEDLASQAVTEFAAGVESSVVHYGDTTLTFLNNWYRADQRGTALTYVSAAAVEEKSVIDYNAGNPDGVLDPGEQPRPPRDSLVAIYPKEGTLYSDNPFIVLDAQWVDDAQRQAARLFETFVQQPANQRRVLEFGFRPGNPTVAIDDPIVRSNGVDPDQPRTLLEVPTPTVMVELLDRWEQQRKRARVLLVLDVSGSMGDPADPDDSSGATKLDLAKQAAVDALDLFAPDDEVALRIFSTDLGGPESSEYLDLVEYGRVADQAEALGTRIRDLVPTNGTPLYGVTEASYAKALDNYDPTRINAVVLLTDGVNDDGAPDDDDEQFTRLINELRSGSEGQASRPVRVFTISYGADADADVLRRIAEASAAATYSAKDPASIAAVLDAVISNF
jgi:Ca-activated chloride channel family protein